MICVIIIIILTFFDYINWVCLLRVLIIVAINLFLDIHFIDALKVVRVIRCLVRVLIIY